MRKKKIGMNDGERLKHTNEFLFESIKSKKSCVDDNLC